jgi:phosphate transport system protein
VHISRRYDQDLEQLRGRILAMGGNLVGMIKETLRALVERDSPAAKRMIEFDHEINREEVAIDELSLNIIALRQPAARDLRFITLALKVSTDLERIGDLCVNIAERTLELNEEPQLKPYIDLPRMATGAQRMVRESLDAFVSRDTELARRVCAEDADVDALKEQIFRELLTFMMEDARTIPRAIRLILISRFLERVADHATNIAEMVIYMVDSKMVRHTIA